MAVLLFIVGLTVGLGAGVAVMVRRLSRTSSDLSQAQAEAASLEQRLELREQHHTEQLRAADAKAELVKANREQLRDEMKSISGDVLLQTGEALRKQIAAERQADKERTDGELSKRTEEIKRVVEPIGKKLGDMESKVDSLERDRKQSEGQLGQLMRSLQDGVGNLAAQAGSLSAALRRPDTRGSWGEIQLKNVIEMAGMLEHCDFTQQSTIHTDDGRLRPDVLVRLPGGKLVVVDSKVPLDAFLAAQEAENDAERDLALARHAKQTRDHVTKLASKGYQSQFDTTPDLVVMFVPSDGIYHAALAADPALIEYGVEQQVLIATPMTLIGLLRAIHYGWRQELIAESAREIAETGRELHKRMCTFAEPLRKLGRGLTSANTAYNEAIASFDSRVVPQLRKIEAAGASSGRELPEIAPIEATPRPITAAIEAAAEDQAAALPLATSLPAGDEADELGPGESARAA